MKIGNVNSFTLYVRENRSRLKSLMSDRQPAVNVLQLASQEWQLKSADEKQVSQRTFM